MNKQQLTKHDKKEIESLKKFVKKWSKFQELPKEERIKKMLDSFKD